MRFWLWWLASLIGVICLSLIVWFVLPLIEIGETRPLAAIWVLLAIIGGIFAIFLTIFVIQFVRRRRRLKALEAELAGPPEPEGDGKILAERMKGAIAVLKKAGGRRFSIYELPWYVIIGFPGTGKTTALVNSGLKFPLAAGGGDPQAVAGYGSTRHCDWWFTEDAVLIDTAGHYTAQTSDPVADRKSWRSFLKLLVKARPRQPINGVLLAVSIEDLITKEQGELDALADTLRQRLAEIQEEIKIDFPVYVVFTKADLIAGFTEYFGYFSQSRRRLVWGATFRPSEKTQNMVGETPLEFDLLIARLNEELPDRLQEEPDPRARIFTFGFPSQLAALRDRISHLMNRVFEPTRYHAQATLRGFYFTSGTQQGAPIDQVIGSLAKRFQYDKAAMLGPGLGKSYFLHDLLKKVVFAEAGWVSTNAAASRRALAFRVVALLAVLSVSTVLGLLWWSSYGKNSQLLSQTGVALVQYYEQGRDRIEETSINDDNLVAVGPLLDKLRYLPAGYQNRDIPTPIGETYGLSVRDGLNTDSEELYRVALERLFRSRLIYRLEEQIKDHIDDPNYIYNALKVYKMLGGERTDPQVIFDWMAEDWATSLMPGPLYTDNRRSLEQHLVAMLDLGETVGPFVKIDQDLAKEAERTLLRMDLVDRAYALLQDLPSTVAVEDWSVGARGGPHVAEVFEASGAETLADIEVPAFYTYDGFYYMFLDRLPEIEQLLEEDRWLLGESADDAVVSQQLRDLVPNLLTRYSREFITAWSSALSKLRMRRLSADKPDYTTLHTLAAATSPVTLLIESIAKETQLTLEPEVEEEEEAAGGGGNKELNRLGRRVASRVAGRVAGSGGRLAARLALKSQSRAGGGGGDGEAAGPTPGTEVEAAFKEYHDVAGGEPGRRGVDILAANLQRIYDSLIRSVGNPDNPNFDVVRSDLLAELTNLGHSANRLPQPFRAMFEQVPAEFERDSTNASIEQLNAKLQQDIVDFCRRTVSGRYPFVRDSNREVALQDFGDLFGVNGVLDSFFNQYLKRYADTSGDVWTWKTDSPISGKLSPNTLRSFQRAAEIREAFFTYGREPSVDFLITPRGIHESLEQAQLTVGRMIILGNREGGFPNTVSWPRDGGIATVSLMPQPPNQPLGGLFGQASQPQVPPAEREKLTLTKDNSYWAFFQLLDTSNANLTHRGNSTTATFTVRGRWARFEITPKSRVSPIRLPAVGQFECPTAL